uniref:hypothetical protein n=1 Tax=Proteus mirabilis TaxID=584 RepID=UPI0013D2C0E5
MVTQNAAAGAISLGATGAGIGHADSADGTENRRDTATEPRHPRVIEPATLLLVLVMSVFGGIIGMQILTTLGITPN